MKDSLLNSQGLIIIFLIIWPQFVNCLQLYDQESFYPDYGYEYRNRHPMMRVRPKSKLCTYELNPELELHCSERSELIIENEQLSILRPNIFDAYPNLRKISFSNNQLYEIPDTMFDQLSRLSELNLGGNRLTSLHENLFSRTQLTRLILSNNRLKDVPEKLFEKLSELKWLDLSGNHLKTLHPDTFKYTEKLIDLNLEKNQISSMESIGWFSSIIFSGYHTINLSSNQIRELSSNALTNLFITFNNVILSSNKDLKTIPKIDYERIPRRRSKLFLNENALFCDLELFDKLENYRAHHIELYGDNSRCINSELFGQRSVIDMFYTGVYIPIELGLNIHSRTKVIMKDCSDNKSCMIEHLPRFQNILEKYNTTNCALMLQNTKIIQLPKMEPSFFKCLQHLEAQNSSLKVCALKDLAENLEYLDLSDNKLNQLNEEVIKRLNASKSLKTLKLKGNPWTCDCDFVRFTRSNVRKIDDYMDILCNNGIYLRDKYEWCLWYTQLFAALIFIFFCFGIFLVWVLKYEYEIKVWLYAHKLFSWIVHDNYSDEGKRYDAFISFVQTDAEFVMEKLVPELENGPIPFNVCLHRRDWPTDEFITNLIYNSIKDSHRVIFVLSKEFLKTIWHRVEFRAAHKIAIGRHRVPIIFVIYDKGYWISSDIGRYMQMKRNTTVKWGDRHFFDKLFYAMPHKTRRSRNKVPIRRNDLEDGIRDTRC